MAIEKYVKTLKDDFNRANQEPATGWTDFEGLGLAIVSNRLVGGAGGGGGAYWAADTNLANFEFYFTFGAACTGSDYLGWRMDGTGGGGYDILYGNGNVLDDGVLIGSFASTLFQAGDEICVQHIGQNLEIFRKPSGGTWASIFTATTTGRLSGRIQTQLYGTCAYEDFYIATLPTFGTNAVLLDDFNRANATDLGANWGTDLFAGHTSFDISSNRLVSGTGYESNYFENFFTSFIDAYFSIITLPSSGDVRFWARLQNPTNQSTINGHGVEIGSGGNGYWFRLNAGATTAGPSIGGAGTFANGDKLGLRILRDTQELWRYRSGSWTLVSAWADLSMNYDPGYVGISTENATGLVIDDVYAAIVPVNQFSNPNFEVNIAGWEATGSATVVRSTADSHSGQACLDVTTHGTNLWLGVRCDPVEVINIQGQALTFSFWLKAATGGDVGKAVRAKVISMNSAVEYDMYINLPATWTQYSRTITFEDAMVQYRFDVRDDNGTSTRFLLDDVYADVSPLYAREVLADSPTIYLRMEEASGKPQDASGNDNHAFTWYNSSWGDGSALPSFYQSSPITSDPLDHSIRWNGDAFCETPSNAGTLVGDVFTLEAWVKRTRTGVSEMIIGGHGDGATKGAGAMGFDSSNYVSFSRYTIADIVKSTITITDTNWHHIVATKNGATSKLYIDGVDVTGTVTNYTCSTDEGLFGIGGSIDNNQIMNGYIDEAAIYPTALSAARVLAHYNARATLALDSCLPDADVTTTGWTTTPLWSKVNDASDATVIQATAV